ncbi:hypothetical protein UlMin_024884 [Ulmus minor]
MENKMGDRELKNLVKELRRGKELVGQLQIHLMNKDEAREVLVRRILSSYDKALSMINSATSIGDLQDQECQPSPSECSPIEDSKCKQEPKDTSKKKSVAIRDLQDQSSSGVETLKSESTVSCSGSCRNKDSDKQYPKDTSKKRRKSSLKKWSTVVRGFVHDGYTWRKYGEKAILGCKYTRKYYRCADKYLQGCLATKQVQQSDEDPTLFKTTYYGVHTCTQVPDKILFPEPQTVVTEQSDNPRQQTSSSFNFASSSSDVTVETRELLPNLNLKITHSIVSPEISGTSTLSVGEAEMGKFGSVHQNLPSSKSSKPVTFDLFPNDH